MDAALWELLGEGEGQDEVAAILRLGQPGTAPPGVRLVAEFGNIATCRLQRGDILPTREAEDVASFKAPRIFGPEPEVEEPLPEDISEAQAFVDERRPPGETATGRGCIIGVVDWGCDFAHPDFRNDDGTTRLLALWDQRPNPSRTPPSRYGYGVVHTREDINRALTAANPYQALGYHPADADTGQGSHGTHVLGIAAGNGRGGAPAGVAPESDIVFVHSATLAQEGPDRLGDSVTLLEAVDFINNIAGNRPWVINLSMGKHGEPHDGTTLAEQAFDQILTAAPGRAIVQSTGNYFDRRIHSCGQLRPAERRELTWEVQEVDPTPNQLEIWYAGADTFSVEITGPLDVTRQAVALGQQAAIKLGEAEIGTIYHRRAEPNNFSNHIEIFLYRGAPSGSWSVTIKAEDIVDGRYHAWVERDAACGSCQSRFAEEDTVSTSTTGTICNGFRTIAVGAYNLHSDQHEVARFSSSGPTRDGRVKPDLVAPGVRILAARSRPRESHQEQSLSTRMSGTSMASPYVAGTVALMFEAAGRPLRIEETHNLLLANTRKAHPAGEDVARMGSGYCDISGAVEAARTAAGPTAAKLRTEAVMEFEHPDQWEAALPENEQSATDPVHRNFVLIPDALEYEGTSVSAGFEHDPDSIAFGESFSECANTIPAPLGEDYGPAGHSLGINSVRSDERHGLEAELLELADEVIHSAQSGRPHRSMLGETLERVTGTNALVTTHPARSVSPAAIFEAFAYGKNPAARKEMEQIFEVVALPRSPIAGMRQADILFRHPLAEGAFTHAAMLASGEALKREELNGRGITPESARSGYYSEVVEAGHVPHRRSDRFARRLADDSGLLAHDSLILRIRRSDGLSRPRLFETAESDAEEAAPTITDGRDQDEIIVTRADSTRYHVRRKVRAQVLTRPGRPRIGFCRDDERAFVRASWCEGTQGTIDVGANIPAAFRDLLNTVVGQINRGDTPEQIAQTFENAQVQTFVQLAIAKDKDWAFTGDFRLELNPGGILSKSASVSFDKGWGKVGVEYRDDGTGRQVRVTVDIPLGNRTVRGKKCPVQELAIWWDAECLREVRTTYTIPTPGFRMNEETLYLYFEHAQDILRRDPKSTRESADVVNEILNSNPKLGTALLNKRTLERLDYLVGQGYWLDSVKGYTSPEGRRGPPKQTDRGAAAKWEGNDELARERAKKVRDLIEARYVRIGLQMRNLPPRMRFPSGKSMPTEVGLSECPKLDKRPGVELEGSELDRVMIHGGITAECCKKAGDEQKGKEQDKPFLKQCPDELARMTEDDRKYISDARMSDRKRAELLFENLRRVEIHLRQREKLRDVDVPGTDLIHEHDCPPDVIDAAERKWGTRIPFTKPDPPLCGLAAMEISSGEQISFAPQPSCGSTESGRVSEGETFAEQISVDDVASEMNGLRCRFLSMYPARRADGSARTFSDGALLPIDDWNGTGTEATVAGFNVPKIILEPAPDVVSGMRRYEVALTAQRNAVAQNASELSHWVSREGEFTRNHASWERERTRLETLLQRRQATYSRMWVRQMMYNRFDVDISRWVNHYNTQLNPSTMLDPNIVKSMLYQESRMGTSGAHLMPPPSDWSSSDRHPIRSRFNLGQAIDSWGPQQWLMIREMGTTIFTRHGLNAFERTWFSMSNDDYAAHAPFITALREFFEFRDSSNRNLNGTTGRDLHEDYSFWIRTAIRWLFVKYANLGRPTWAEAVRAYNGGGARARAYRDAVMARVGSTDAYTAESTPDGVAEDDGVEIAPAPWLEDAPTLDSSATLTWEDLSRVPDSRGQPQVFYVVTGAPASVAAIGDEGKAIFNLRVRNTNTVYNHKDVATKYRVLDVLPNRQFREVMPWRRFSGPDLEDESSRVIKLSLSSQTLLAAYNPDSPLTRLEVEYHWRETWEDAQEHFNRTGLDFVLVAPIEYMLSHKRRLTTRDVELNDPVRYKADYWIPVTGVNFSADIRQPVTIQLDIMSSVSGSATGQQTTSSGQTRSTTRTSTTSNTFSVQLNGEVSQGGSAKASIEVLELGVQEMFKLGASLGYSRTRTDTSSTTVAREFTRSLMLSRTYATSQAVTTRTTLTVSPPEVPQPRGTGGRDPGGPSIGIGSVGVYLYPLVAFYEVPYVRFEGVNARGQATRRSEGSVAVPFVTEWRLTSHRGG